MRALFNGETGLLTEHGVAATTTSDATNIVNHRNLKEKINAYFCVHLFSPFIVDLQTNRLIAFFREVAF